MRRILRELNLKRPTTFDHTTTDAKRGQDA